MLGDCWLNALEGRGEAGVGVTRSLCEALWVRPSFKRFAWFVTFLECGGAQ